MPHKIIKSGSASAFTSVLYLILARVLDDYIDPVCANLISLGVTTILNFILQTLTFFSLNKININIIMKYIATTIIVDGLNHYLFEKWYIKTPTKDPKELTKRRILIGSSLFFIISYPSRKYWIFI